MFLSSHAPACQKSTEIGDESSVNKKLPAFDGTSIFGNIIKAAFGQNDKENITFIGIIIFFMIIIMILNSCEWLLL